MGSDAFSARKPPIIKCFNPRSRVGSDSLESILLAPRLCFNPRSRVGSDYPHLVHQNRIESFNPRSRVGSDARAQVADDLSSLVSIHAPAWGATHRSRGRGHTYRVSIHAPAWGATGLTQPNRLWMRCFNPRSRVGSDRHPHRQYLCHQGFNPRSRVGSDWSLLIVFCTFYQFQSTLPRGERP